MPGRLRCRPASRRPAGSRPAAKRCRSNAFIPQAICGSRPRAYPRVARVCARNSDRRTDSPGMTNTATPCHAPTVPRRTQRRSPHLFSFVFPLLASLVLLPSLFLRFPLFLLLHLVFLPLRPSCPFLSFLCLPVLLSLRLPRRRPPPPPRSPTAPRRRPRVRAPPPGPAHRQGASGNNPRADSLSAAARLAPMPGTTVSCSIVACATASTESTPVRLQQLRGRVPNSRNFSDVHVCPPRSQPSWAPLSGPASTRATMDRSSAWRSRGASNASGSREFDAPSADSERKRSKSRMSPPASVASRPPTDA